jgi:hypothetical protein
MAVDEVMPWQTVQVYSLKSLQLKEAVPDRVGRVNVQERPHPARFVRPPVFRLDDSVFSPVFMQFGIHQPSSSTKANVRSPPMGQVISCVHCPSCSAPIDKVPDNEVTWVWPTLLMAWWVLMHWPIVRVAWLFYFCTFLIAVLFTFCLCIVINIMSCLLPSRNYDTIYKPCSNNYDTIYKPS